MRRRLSLRSSQCLFQGPAQPFVLSRESLDSLPELLVFAFEPPDLVSVCFLAGHIRAYTGLFRRQALSRRTFHPAKQIRFR